MGRRAVFQNGKGVLPEKAGKAGNSGDTAYFILKPDRLEAIMAGAGGTQVLDRPYFFILRHRVVRGRFRMRALSPVW